jgi:hypothetical protein
VSINYNIENTVLFKENKKTNLMIKGWAVCDNGKIDISICGYSNYDISFEKRPDVFSYFNCNKYALNSGIIIRVYDIKQDSVNINLKDNDESKTHTIYIKNLKKSSREKIITKENVDKLYKSLRNYGLINSVKKVVQKIKGERVAPSSMEISEPYVYIEEPFETKSFSLTLDVIINASNTVCKDYLGECCSSIKGMKFSSIYFICNKETKDEINNLCIENLTVLECSKNLKTKQDCIRFVKENATLKSNYVMYLNGTDKLSSNAYHEVLSIAQEKPQFDMITANEDRFEEYEYFGPFYKKYLFMNENRINIDKLIRCFVVIKTEFIDNFINGDVNVANIYVIDKVLYHFRLIKADRTNIKPIAFYLPQFHAIPENDEWWGKGFTEWVNVKKGVPMFNGHYQPHVPGEQGYYNLVEDKSIQYKQIELAKQYNIYGFCYYYYWFKGKRLLEKPLDKLLGDKNLDFPFCICWANETWSRRWDGQESQVLMQQVHDDETDRMFIYDVLPILKDERYIKIDNDPLLIIYRAELFPNLSKTVDFWRKVCLGEGLQGLKVAMVQTFGISNPAPYGCDYAVEFPPHNIPTAEISKQMTGLVPEFSGNIYDYKDVAARAMNKPYGGYPMFRGVMLSWDNTARRGTKSNIYAGANPQEYKKWIASIADYTSNMNNEYEQFVFINAWNEWAEGTHLEPDQKYGMEYLEVTRDAICSI